MSSIFKTIDWSVGQLVDGVETGMIQLPDLQRPFVWSSSKVRDLFDSMYRGYPVGELMFWDSNPEDESFRSINVHVDRTVQHQIIDGQQRLTSLFAAMTGTPVRDSSYKDRRIVISFNPFEERFEVRNSAIEKSPHWITDIADVFKENYKTRRDFKKRYAAAHGELTDEQDERLEEILNRLKQLDQYRFNVIHIGAEADKSVVAEIFVRINSEGASLNAADYILTWLSVFWPEGRESIEQFARNSRMTPDRVSEIEGETVTWTPKNPFIEVETSHVVRALVAVGLNRAPLQDAYTALQAKPRHSNEIDHVLFEENLQRLQSALPLVINHTNWSEFLHSLQLAGFRSRKNITSTMNLIYSYVLFLLGRTRYNVELKPLREITAQWVFMSQLTNRYTGSPESQMSKDLALLDPLEDKDADGFLKVLNRVITAELPQDFWAFTLPEKLTSSGAAQSPAYQSYLAALNVLDADVFMLNMPVSQWMDPHAPKVRGLEYHHLFPKNYLRGELSIDDKKRLNQVANFAPTDWDTNNQISDAAPAVYWPTLVDTTGFAPDRLQKHEYWHALPENWADLPYDDFLEQRRKLIAAVTRDGFQTLRGGSSNASMTKPTQADEDEQHVALETLVAQGLLKPGDQLTPIDPEWQVDALINEDGLLVIDSVHEFSSLDDAARHVGADNLVGGEFWAIERGDELVAVESLL